LPAHDEGEMTPLKISDGYPRGDAAYGARINSDSK